MKKIFLVCFTMFITLGLIMQSTQAGRFGGGRSFGYHRSASSFSRPAMSPSPMNSYARSNNNGNRWLGPLAGLAIGGLIGSMLGNHGLGGGIFSWLLILGAGFFILQFFRNRMQPATRPMEYNATPINNSFNSPFTSNVQPNHSTANMPLGFNTDEFLRTAKTQFIRLQTAYDTKNLADIREFTTPEVAAEIQLQFQERGDAENFTEVVTLQAELLNAETTLQNSIATVRFTGTIKEEREGTPQAFNEIWHFTKEMNSSIWKVSGLQQF